MYQHSQESNTINNLRNIKNNTSIAKRVLEKNAY